jgi:DNA modification methylase
MTRPFWTDGTVTIRHGNALALPQPDASVDLVVTSPPFFGLRSYTDGGEHYGGQIGSEATPGEFLDALAAATAEMTRVLKPSGSIFVNLGDKYAQNTERSRNGLSGTLDGGKPLRDAAETVTTPRRSNGVPTKSLMLLPERYRIRCVDDLGLIARAVIVWAKPNGLPESVKDRVRRSHEDWVHLTREPRYFSGIDEIREPSKPENLRYFSTQGQNTTSHGVARRAAQGRSVDDPANSGRGIACNPLGKLPGSVWTIPTQPLRVPPELGIDHFAAFPMEWPSRLIRGWSPAGVCVECGEGRRPVRVREMARGASRSTITGYSCACDVPTAPTRPAVVLDSFGGTGTTVLMARALGRQGHYVDLSADYCRLAEWRLTDARQAKRAARVAVGA